MPAIHSEVGIQMNATRWVTQSMAAGAQRISKIVQLTEQDWKAFDHAFAPQVRTTPAQYTLIREGEQAKNVYLILSGWACCTKILPNGRRQILSFQLPGDLCDPFMYLLPRVDYSIFTLTEVICAEVSREIFERLITDHPRLARASYLCTLQQAARQREWAVSLGQRVASQRLAHLFYDIYTRLREVGMTNGNFCHFPATQADIGDATGLSTVHVNRTMQDLRAAELIRLSHRRLEIRNLERLRSAALIT